MNVNVEAHAGVFTASPATMNKSEAGETSEGRTQEILQWT